MPAPAKLNLDAILDEAINLLQSEGLEAITMRHLAGRLGVEAPSLYRHTGPKPRLLSAMTLRLFRRQLDEVGVRNSWQVWLDAFGRKLWQTQTEIPDCARLVLSTNFTDAELAMMTEWAAAALRNHDIASEHALAMMMSVQAFVLGLGGLADGPNAAQLRDAVPIETIFETTLGVLIDGWKARIEGKYGPNG
ncbi:TetR family transcriptional regulator [Novosphingobium sp.]|uniref:TetR family transcriptional regulator n=1 Tax=Novosphingobium sp. TaxID=1874826 RepID=UPI003563DB43